MKSNSFFMQTLLFVFFAFVGLNTGVIAQKTTPKKVVYCDELLPRMKQEAQKQADETCSTKTTCVQCTERKSGITINSTLVIQPGCNKIKIEDAMAESGASAAKAPAMTDDIIHVEILQTPCINGGISLQAFLPLTCSHSRCQGNTASNKGQEALPAECVTFMWELDGRKAGHGQELTCVCGKEVILHVNGPDGSRVTKKIKILSCDPPSGNKE